MPGAHRPTFVHAVGKEKVRSSIVHERALPGTKTVKTRAPREQKDDSEFVSSTAKTEPDAEKEETKPLEAVQSVEPRKEPVAVSKIAKPKVGSSWRNQKRKRHSTAGSSANTLDDKHQKFIETYMK